MKRAPRSSRRRQPSRTTFRPTLEYLESRLAPSNTPILSGHNDNLLSGWNSQETVLTPTNVNDASFGRLANYTLDGYAYAQPLYMPNLNIPGKGTHNVVFAATEHDSVYAFDGDGGGLLWQRNFTDPTNGITTVPAPQDVNTSDIVPEIGITGTPVIDPGTNTLFVVAKTKEVKGTDLHYVQKLYALDVTTGSDKFGGPVVIGDTIATNPGNPNASTYTYVSGPAVVGTGAGSTLDSDNVQRVHFNALRENQRTALQLVTNADSSKTVYIAWASHGDNGPYHGWVLGYSASNLALQKVFNASPNGSASGIWESGGNFGVDAQGNLYFATGNGFGTGFDANGGARALGAGGGALGYGNGSGNTPTGITNSVAVTFRAFDNGHSSTGLGENASFLTPNDLTGTGIDFNASAQATTPHIFQVTLSYSGTTLTETIKDLTTNATVTETYNNLNIAQFVGGNTAYVGFTGGTGGLNGQQDVLNWTFTPTTGSAIDHSTGFASNSDLLANGAAFFSGSAARITPATNNASGSIFSTNQVNITGFTTTFQIQMKAGSSTIADGMTFTIQAKPAGTSYSESVLKLSTTGPGQSLPVLDFFTPTDWKNLDNNDTDLGSGGTILLPDAVGSTAHPHLIVETGKSGRLYLLDRDHLGENVPSGTNDQILQTVTIGGPGVWGNAAFFQDGPNTGLIYYWGTSNPGQAFRITNGVINATPVTMTAANFAFPGSQPIISSNGSSSSATNAIMWAVRDDNFAQNGPETLYAYNAEDLSKLLYVSNDVTGRDTTGTSVKFVTPIVTNGHVYVPSNGFLTVYGLFPANTTAPATPGGFQVAQVSPAQGGDTKLQLSWTNPNPNTATLFKIERSATGATGPFTQIAQIGGDQSTFIDTGLSPLTHYWYRIRATNQIGDSAFTTVADAFTRLSGATLSVTAITSLEVDLSWTSVISSATGNHYNVERSTDNFATFTTLASNLSPSQLTYADTTITRGTTYQYRIHAFNVSPAPTDESFSNVAVAAVAPVDIEFPFPNGIQNANGLAINGSAVFSSTEKLLRLNNDQNQAGSVFTSGKVSDSKFSTTFWIRLHEGTQPNPADGLTFTIQASSPTALGALGSGLGYQLINRSVAIKFDVFNNIGESDNSTGLFFNGDAPELPNVPGEVNVPLDATVVNLRDQHRKRVDISYDASTLQLKVTITDEQHDGGPTSVTQTYTVDIPSILGGDGAFVGFTGGTGGSFSLQDILGWVFPTTQVVGPGNLQVTAGAGSATLNWTPNSTDENGFMIERSLDNYHFDLVGQAGVGAKTFTDTGLDNNTVYFYRVRAFNDAATSGPSNTVAVTLGGTVTTIDHSNGFGSNLDLQANGSARYQNPSTSSGTIGIFTNNQDIGTTGDPMTAGTSSFSNGSYTLTATGSDIGGTADHMQFLYKFMTNDGEIIARLASFNNTDFNSKAGLMIRADTTAGSANAFMLETGPNGGHNEPFFQWRSTTGGATSDSGNHVNNIQSAPIWLRLVRSGNTFTGYWAVDINNGQSHGQWQDFGGTQVVNLPTTGNVLVGLGLTAHNNTSAATAVFDHVSVITSALLTDANGNEAGSVLTTSKVPVTGSFTTSFILNARPASATSDADGITFVIEADPRGSSALGGGGGSLGYQGIPNSVAIKFDLFSQGSHKSTTGLFVNGGSTSGTAGQVDMSTAGIDFRQNHTYQVDLAYDGLTLTETVRDLVSGKVFTTSYALDLRATIGSDTAYVGFTGATGGEAAWLAIESWTASFNSLAAPNHLEVHFPSTTSGAPQIFTLAEKDAAGTALANYRGTVHFSSSDSLAILPDDYTFTASDKGAHTFAGVLFAVGTQTITATDDSSTPLTDAPSILVNPKSFVLSGFPSQTTAGDSHTFTVTARDYFGNTATGYAGTVHFTSTDAQAGLPDDYNFTAGDAGVHTFTAILKTAGTQSITVTDPITPQDSKGTESGITVVHAAFSNLVLSGFPSTTTAGSPQSFTVTAKDAFGNTINDFTGTVHFASTDTQADLPNDYTFSLSDGGTQTFAATLKTAGMQSLTVTADSGVSATQDGILVTPGVAVGFKVIVPITDVTANNATPVIVTAVDAYGNEGAIYTGTIHFSSSDTTATFANNDGTALSGSNYTFKPSDNGTHVFMVTFKTTGTQSVIVTDTLDATIFGEFDNVNVG
jgi:hypothetical protein